MPPDRLDRGGSQIEQLRPNHLEWMGRTRLKALGLRPTQKLGTGYSKIYERHGRRGNEMSY